MNARDRREPFPRALAWEILDDLVDRPGIPAWIAERANPDAQDIADSVREIIQRRLRETLLDG